MALSSVAVLAVYSAGYLRTQDAAEAMDLEMAAHRAAGRGAAVPSAVDPAPLQQLRDTIQAAHDSLPTKAVVPTPAEAATREPAPVAIVAAPRDTTPAPVVAPTESDATPKPGVPPIPEYVPPPAAPPPPPAAAATTDSAASNPRVPKPLRDGVFHGYGSSRHGDIEVRIEVAGQKVVYAEISRCLTRWPCTIVERLPAQVIERQTADVDIITGATASSDAFYMAVLDAFSTSRGK